MWYVIYSSTGQKVALGPWGTPTDTPIPGDYDGDGKTDMAVWRPTNGLVHSEIVRHSEDRAGWGHRGFVGRSGRYSYFVYEVGGENKDHVMREAISNNIATLFKEGLAQLAIEADETVLKKFEDYLHELKKWNKAYNLTALTSDVDVIVKHFLDSLLYMKAFPSNPPIHPLSIREGGGLEVCDAGSGAGFPGLPIALVRPQITVTLAEPSRKKCAFLRHVKRLLGLDNVTVCESRIEDLKDMRFDIVMTRALFDTAGFIKTAGYLLREGGCLLLSKGPKFEEEIKGLPNSYEVITVPLPTTSISRKLIRIYNSSSAIKHA